MTVPRHLLLVAPGAHLLSDALISSPILSADRAGAIPAELGGTGDAGGPAATAAGDQFEFGVDPSLDPELAMVIRLHLISYRVSNLNNIFQALRMSMEEAQAREAAERAASTSNQNTSTPSAPPPAAAPVAADPTDDEEAALLEQAIAMSQDVEMDASRPTAGTTDAADMDEDEDEEAAIARAIEMSMKGEEEDSTPKK